MPVRQWKLARHSLPYGERTLVMAVLNITPDSFSDGGEFFSLDSAVAHAEQMILEGADLIDIGGESTRPGSAFVTEEEELQRVIPVIERLAAKSPVPISIDTTKSSVAYAAIAAGAEIVNDISGLRFDPSIADEAAKAKTVKLEGLHNCCPACTTAITETLKSFGKVDAKPRQTEEVTDATARRSCEVRLYFSCSGRLDANW